MALCQQQRKKDYRDKYDGHCDDDDHEGTFVTAAIFQLVQQRAGILERLHLQPRLGVVIGVVAQERSRDTTSHSIRFTNSRPGRGPRSRHPCLR